VEGALAAYVEDVRLTARLVAGALAAFA
jgi:hypothetical protein